MICYNCVYYDDCATRGAHHNELSPSSPRIGRFTHTHHSRTHIVRTASGWRARLIIIYFVRCARGADFNGVARAQSAVSAYLMHKRAPPLCMFLFMLVLFCFHRLLFCCLCVRALDTVCGYNLRKCAPQTAKSAQRTAKRRRYVQYT